MLAGTAAVAHRALVWPATQTCGSSRNNRPGLGRHGRNVRQVEHKEGIIVLVATVASECIYTCSEHTRNLTCVCVCGRSSRVQSKACLKWGGHQHGGDEWAAKKGGAVGEWEISTAIESGCPAEHQLHFRDPRETVAICRELRGWLKSSTLANAALSARVCALARRHGAERACYCS